jgi:hypothetical protein
MIGPANDPDSRFSAITAPTACARRLAPIKAIERGEKNISKLCVLTGAASHQQVCRTARIEGETASITLTWVNDDLASESRNTKVNAVEL